MNYQDINAQTIDRWVEEGWEWGMPIDHKTYIKATKGEWDMLLTPTKFVPHEWFGELKGKKVLGLASGYFGGWTDELIMRGVDVMLCFPSFFLILAVIAFLEPSLTNIMVVIGFTSWMGVARLVRAETLSLRERDFIAASKLAGASAPRLLFVHILPNALAPVLVSATLGVAGAILVESSLSFLGLGVQPPDASWGNMLMEGKNVLEIAPWLSLWPGLAILVTVLGYNLLGESLRDLLDPRLKER